MRAPARAKRPKWREPSPPPDGAMLLEFWEVAWILRCSTATVRRMAEAGFLPTVAISPTGHRKTIRRASLDHYIRTRERTADPAAEAEASKPATKPAPTITAAWADDSDPFARPVKIRATRPKS